MTMAKKFKSQNQNRETGVYLILIAFFLFVLVALCGLVIGLGFLSTNKSRLQNIANVSSIAALESFIQARTPNTGEPLPYTNRRAAAVSRTNELIVANKKLPGVRFDLGEVGLAPNGGPGGKLTFGMWYAERPSDGTTPCGAAPADYPCFITNPDVPVGTPYANAVKLELSSQPSNPFVGPFLSIFGAHGIDLNSSSIARVVQRCVAFLLDVSMSTVQETHVSTSSRVIGPPCLTGGKDQDPPCPPCMPPPYGNCLAVAPTPGLIIKTPFPSSLFAYQVSALSALPSLTPPPAPAPHPCQDMANFYDSEEFLYFCNMAPSRPAGAMPAPYNEHYRSDYSTHPSIWGTVFVDKFEESLNTYVGPQPLSRFFLAFNAGLRAVNQIRSPGDKGLLYVFSGDAIGTEPAAGATYELTENFNTLIQLTNIYNRGTIDGSGNQVHPVITPNFVSRGFFPVLADHTNVVGNNSNHGQALWDAIQALSNCPDSARRSIIIATDGIPTCAWNRLGNDLAGNPRPTPAVDCAPPLGGDYYTNYLAAEAAILGPLKDELIKRGITVTTLLDSSAIEPNFKNILVPPSANMPAGTYINPDDALKYGYCAGVPDDPNCPPAQAFFNAAPHIPPVGHSTHQEYQTWRTANGYDDDAEAQDHFAFLAKDGPQYEVKFRRPNALWAQLAMDTGGVICPLLSNCEPSTVYENANPPVLSSAARALMTDITCAPIRSDKAQQAINCVLAAIGVNPYQNVEEIPPTLAASAN